MAHVQRTIVSASLARLRNSLLLGMNSENCFRIFAAGTEYKFLDENIKHLLQLDSFVSTVDDKTIILQIKLRLGTQFATKKLCRVW